MDRSRPPPPTVWSHVGVAALCFLGASLIAAPARASDMLTVGVAFCCPVNALAAMIVFALGIPEKGRRPGALGNLVVWLLGVGVGVLGLRVAWVSTSYAFDGDVFAIGYLATYATFLAALAFTIHSRMAWNDAEAHED